jgi:hypothetical protein
VGVLLRIRVWAVIGMLGGALLAAPALSRAQVQFPTPGTTPADPQGVFSRDHQATGEEPFGTHEIQQRQLKRLRQEHQQELIADTDRLVKLATVLKEEVDKGNETTEPTDVLKQTDEISKLAKKVSERIKNQ